MLDRESTLIGAHIFFDLNLQDCCRVNKLGIRQQALAEFGEEQKFLCETLRQEQFAGLHLKDRL